MRKEMGRASVEPNLRQVIMERDGRMEGLFSHVVLTSRDAPVCAIVCNDVSDLLHHVVRHRQVDPHDHLVKVGIDGGGGMLKVTCNIISGPDSNEMEASSSSAPSLRLE